MGTQQVSMLFFICVGLENIYNGSRDAHVWCNYISETASRRR